MTATRSRYLYICPTTQLLYQGAEQARKMKPEVPLDASDPRGHSLFAFNLAIMKKIDSCAHSVSIVYLINVKWQLILIGCLWKFNFRNIALWLAVK